MSEDLDQVCLHRIISFAPASGPRCAVVVKHTSSHFFNKRTTYAGNWLEVVEQDTSRNLYKNSR